MLVVFTSKLDLHSWWSLPATCAGAVSARPSSTLTEVNKHYGHSVACTMVAVATVVVVMALCVYILMCVDGCMYIYCMCVYIQYILVTNIYGEVCVCYSTDKCGSQSRNME